MMNFLTSIEADIESHLITYGVMVIFVIIYFESFGAPLPGETGVIAAGLLAAKGAGLPCLITTSTYTVDEDFGEADRVDSELGDEPNVQVTLEDLNKLAADAAA